MYNMIGHMSFSLLKTTIEGDLGDRVTKLHEIKNTIY